VKSCPIFNCGRGASQSGAAGRSSRQKDGSPKLRQRRHRAAALEPQPGQHARCGSRARTGPAGGNAHPTISAATGRGAGCRTIFPPKGRRSATALLCFPAPGARMSFIWTSTRSMAQAYPQVIVSQRTLFELEVHYIDSLDRIWQNAIALQNFTLQGGLEKPVAP
jgi:hypothetical protein